MYPPTKALLRHRIEDERGLHYAWTDPAVQAAMTRAHLHDPITFVENPALACQDAFSRALHTARPIAVTPEMWEQRGKATWDGKSVWFEFDRPRTFAGNMLEGALVYRVTLEEDFFMYCIIGMGKGKEVQRFFQAGANWEAILPKVDQGDVLYQVLPLLNHAGKSPKHPPATSEPTAIMLARLERRLKIVKQYSKFTAVLTRHYLDNRTWPSDVFVPVSEAGAMMMLGGYNNEEAVMLGGYLSVLTAWKYSKTVIRIDPDVLEQLRGSRGPSVVPSSLELGSQAIYVPVPSGLYRDYDTGFFAAMDILEGKRRLTLLLEKRLGGGIMLSLLSFAVGESIEAQLHQMAGQGMNFTAQDIPAILEEINFTLLILSYLASPKTDLSENPKGIQASSKKGRKTEIREPSPQLITAGKEVGDKLRAYQVYQREQQKGAHASGTGRSTAPHIRKPHRHTYWVGKGRETYIVHFLDYIPVGMKKGSDKESPVRLK